jgi:hypothetical protein
MQKQPPIPQKYHADILAMAADNVSAIKISEYLLTTYSVVSYPSEIHNIISNHKKERREIASVVYADEVLKTANKDLRITDEVIDTLRLQFFLHIKSNPAIANNLAKTLNIYLQFRKSLLGVEKTEISISNDSELLDSLTNKLTNIK